MSEENETAAQQRDRSPAFPVVGLETAVQRLAEFDAHFKRSPARPEKIGDAWKIKTKAYADRIAAALRYFGLLEYQGTGKGRSVVVSEEGRKYLRAQQEETKHEIIKAAALRPKQIAQFWASWGKDRPANAACLDELVLKNSFSEAGARDFLKVYDSTITFAGLSDSDKPAPDLGEQEPAPMTSQTTNVLDRPSSSIKPPAATSPMLQEVFNLDEGPVTLSYPSALTQDSYEELKDALELFLRRAQRRARLRDLANMPIEDDEPR